MSLRLDLKTTAFADRQKGKKHGYTILIYKIIMIYFLMLLERLCYELISCRELYRYPLSKNKNLLK